MAVVLHLDVGVLGLDFVYQTAEGGWTAHTGHVFQANLVGTELDEIVDDTHVVLHGVDG